MSLTAPPFQFVENHAWSAASGIYIPEQFQVVYSGITDCRTSTCCPANGVTAFRNTKLINNGAIVSETLNRCSSFGSVPFPPNPGSICAHGVQTFSPNCRYCFEDPYCAYCWLQVGNARTRLQGFVDTACATLQSTQNDLIYHGSAITMTEEYVSLNVRTANYMYVSSCLPLSYPNFFTGWDVWLFNGRARHCGIDLCSPGWTITLDNDLFPCCYNFVTPYQHISGTGGQATVTAV